MEIYKHAGRKSTNTEEAGVVDVLNTAITKVIEVVDLDPATVRDLMKVKLDVNREFRGLAGAR